MPRETLTPIVSRSSLTEPGDPGHHRLGRRARHERRVMPERSPGGERGSILPNVWAQDGAPGCGTPRDPNGSRSSRWSLGRPAGPSPTLGHGTRTAHNPLPRPSGEPVALTPPELHTSEGSGPSRKHTNSRVIVVGIVTLITLLGAPTVGFAALRGNTDGPRSAVSQAPCESGVRWQQKQSPFQDGVALGVPALNEVSIMQGGARIGFPNAAEFAAMGLSSYLPVSADQYTALDLAPRDGTLLRERSFNRGAGRLYYATGGAVFQIRNAAELRSIQVDPSSAIVIPAQGLDGAPRIPQAGTLLRLKGSNQTWIVSGRSREPGDHACQDAHVSVLPNDGQVLDDIPLTDRKKLDP